MLTKQDLDKAVAKLTDVFNKRFEDLEIKIEDEQPDWEASLITLRAEMSEDTRKVERRLKKIQDTLDTYIKLSDRNIQETRKRVDRIEDHLNLPPIDQ